VSFCVILVCLVRAGVWNVFVGCFLPQSSKRTCAKPYQTCHFVFLTASERLYVDEQSVLRGLRLGNGREDEHQVAGHMLTRC
jgi:hypothetical protein